MARAQGLSSRDWPPEDRRLTVALRTSPSPGRGRGSWPQRLKGSVQGLALETVSGDWPVPGLELKSKKKVKFALRDQDTKAILSTLFDRLYVLRNQPVHGGATWNSFVNRSQVQDGARIMIFVVPLFIDLMMDNSDKNWGAPHYPVVE